MLTRLPNRHLPFDMTDILDPMMPLPGGRCAPRVDYLYRRMMALQTRPFLFNLAATQQWPGDVNNEALWKPIKRPHKAWKKKGHGGITVNPDTWEGFGRIAGVPRRGLLATVPGSMGFLVFDVDAGDSAMLTAALCARFGKARVGVTRTRSVNGAHVWVLCEGIFSNSVYALTINGETIRGELRGGMGYVVLWDAEAPEVLSDILDETPVTRAEMVDFIESHSHGKPTEEETTIADELDPDNLIRSMNTPGGEFGSETLRRLYEIAAVTQESLTGEAVEQLKTLLASGDDGKEWVDKIAAALALVDTAIDGLRHAKERLSMMTSLKAAPVEPDIGLPRLWLIPHWLPRGEVCRLDGIGGAGKTGLTLAIAAAIASNTDPYDDNPRNEEWRKHHDLGTPVLAQTPQAPFSNEQFNPSREDRHAMLRLDRLAEPEPVLIVTWEDSGTEIQRRLALLPEGRTAEELGKRIHLMNLKGEGPLWAPKGDAHRDTKLACTPAGNRMRDEANRIKPALIIIDPSAAAYAGSENDRSAVRSWLSDLAKTAEETGATILIVGHPPKNTASYSGSTDWRNGVRAAWILSAQNTKDCTYTPEGKDKPHKAKGLSLTLDKANYAKAGTRIWLRWATSTTVIDEYEYHTRGLEICTEYESAVQWHDMHELPPVTGVDTKDPF